MPIRSFKTFCEACETLLEVEAAFDVNAVTCRGIPVWPIIRAQLHYRVRESIFINVCTDSRSETEKSNPHVAKPISVKKPKRVSSRPLQQVFEDDGDLFCVDEADFNRLRGSEAWSPDILIFMHPHEYTEDIDGRAYAKFLDTVADMAEEERNGGRSVAKLELVDPTTIEHERYRPSLFLMPVQKKCSGWPVSGMDQINAVMEDFGLAGIPESEISAILEEALDYAAKFNGVLDVFRPRGVFSVYYPYPPGFGFALACNHRNIPFVDVQHGRMGPCNMRYTHYSRVPRNGYALMPSHIWYWGEMNKQETLAHRPDPSVPPIPVIGGTPWGTLWKERDGLPIATEDEARFQDLVKGRRPVLVALSATADYLLPDSILMVMKEGPSDIIWLVRNHPLQTESNGFVEDILRGEGMDAFNVDLATDLPLYYLFKHVVATVSTFSTTSPESVYFGVPALLTTELGSNLYDQFIADGSMAYISNPKEAAAWLADPPKLVSTPASDALMVSDPDAFSKAMNEILGGN